MITFDQNNDLVAIIVPASGCEDAQQKLTSAQEKLTAHGFRSIVYDNIFTPCELPFFAAPYQIRFDHLKQALLDPQVKIIWAFRGGHGCGELIEDCLNLTPSHPKILIGYSDITVLHSLFNQYYKIPSLHASVLTSLLNNQQHCLPSIINVLEGRKIKVSLQPLQNRTTTEINGQLMGGNLKVLCTMLGTKLQLKAKNKILVLEDVNEKSYQIHRHLVQFKNAGIFAGLKAVIFGDFTKGDDFVEQAIRHFCQNHIPHIPAYKAEGIGHGDNNHPLVLGHKASITGDYLTSTSPFRLLPATGHHERVSGSQKAD